MDRREIVIGGGALALLGSRALAAPGTTTTLQKAQPVDTTLAKANPNIFLPVCRTRPNINSLTPAQLDTLRHGISVMQSRPVSDPTSWLYQAGIHGSNLSPQRPQWGTCQHGTLHFLSWHRLYLYYFERILRAASGSSSLVLPFWNWTADRAVPAPFRTPTSGNSLFVSQRAAGINGGALIPTSAVSTTACMGQATYNGFTGSIEGSPHGSVHVSVGGWMSSFNTAGQDPIFWLHHCNIDRLWDAWDAGAGHNNPSDAGWLNQEFTFFDETGAARTVKMSKALGGCKSLGYAYPRRKILFDATILATQISPQLAQNIRVKNVAETAPSVALGGRPAEAVVNLPPKAVGGVAQKTYLDFDDIAVNNPEGYYEIYLNPPAGKTLDYKEPSYAGNLVLFGLTSADKASMHHAGAMADMGSRRVFDITRKVAAMAGTPGFDAAKLRVVLVLRTPEGGPKPAVDAPRARVGKIRVIQQ